MTAQFQHVRWMAALAVIVLIAAGAGSGLFAGEDDAQAKCREKLESLLACLELFYWDQPAIKAALTFQFLIGYEYCMRYLI